MVEAKFDEYKKATLGDRALLDEKIAKTDGAESAARLFACESERPARGYRGRTAGPERPWGRHRRSRPADSLRGKA
jgi:hypothetical protein